MGEVALAGGCADREIVDAQGLYAALGQVLCALSRHIDVIGGELVASPAAARIGGLEQDALAGRYAMRRELPRIDGGEAGELEHARGAHGGGQRHLVDPRRAGEKMQRRIHVRTRMQAHGDRGEVQGIAALHARSALDAHLLVARPVHHAAAQRNRDVDPRRVHRSNRCAGGDGAFEPPGFASRLRKKGPARAPRRSSSWRASPARCRGTVTPSATTSPSRAPAPQARRR